MPRIGMPWVTQKKPLREGDKQHVNRKENMTTQTKHSEQDKDWRTLARLRRQHNAVKECYQAMRSGKPYRTLLRKAGIRLPRVVVAT